MGRKKGFPGAEFAHFRVHDCARKYVAIKTLRKTRTEVRTIVKSHRTDLAAKPGRGSGFFAASFSSWLLVLFSESGMARGAGTWSEGVWLRASPPPVTERSTRLFRASGSAGKRSRTSGGSSQRSSASDAGRRGAETQ